MINSNTPLLLGEKKNLGVIMDLIEDEIEILGRMWGAKNLNRMKVGNKILQQGLKGKVKNLQTEK